MGWSMGTGTHNDNEHTLFRTFNNNESGWKMLHLKYSLVILMPLCTLSVTNFPPIIIPRIHLRLWDTLLSLHKKHLPIAPDGCRSCHHWGAVLTTSSQQALCGAGIHFNCWEHCIHWCDVLVLSTTWAYFYPQDACLMASYEVTALFNEHCVLYHPLYIQTPRQWHQCFQLLQAFLLH